MQNITKQADWLSRLPILKGSAYAVGQGSKANNQKKYYIYTLAKNEYTY